MNVLHSIVFYFEGLSLTSTSNTITANGVAVLEGKFNVLTFSRSKNLCNSF